MTPESFWKNFESNKNLQQLKKASSEELKKIWEQIEYPNHLRKENDVLNKLNLQNDNQEEEYRKTLKTLDNETLKELTTKSESEILIFLATKELQYTQKIELKKSNLESKANEKISKLQTIFTPEILENHSTLKWLFENLGNVTDKQETLTNIINYLKKDPQTLASIVKEIGWANPSIPQYQEFKNTLILIDPSFEDIFKNFEVKDSLNKNDVINDIKKESNWMLNIDLDSKNPTSKLSLIWSDYSFDEKIDSKILFDVSSKYENNIRDIKNGFAVLKEGYPSLTNLLNNIWASWNKENFFENLKNSVNGFPNDIFWKLDKVYENLEINPDIQLKQIDITSLKDVKTIDELKIKVENIKNKFEKIKIHILKEKNKLDKEYKLDIKNLVDRNKKDKETQMEVLKFMKNSWFDLIPKTITDKIITNLQNNSFQIKGLDLNVQNIDLKNWHFWEWLNFDNEIWFNTMAKRNLIKFINKLISWDINWPLSVKAISNWSIVTNSAYMKNKFKESWIIDWLGWKYGRIVKNLEK